LLTQRLGSVKHNLPAGAHAILTVITISDEDIVYGVNAWRSNARDLRIYHDNQGD
jgi:hypothetical protein